MKNEAEAVKWYRKAAESGVLTAKTNLGECYENGVGVEKDFMEAYKWYREAADENDPRAQFLLAGWYLHHGKPEDWRKNRDLEFKSAEQGYAPAQFMVACDYEKGLGVVKDISKAIEWYQKAADQGNVAAEEALQRLQKKKRGLFG